jgi:hypothetical protein
MKYASGILLGATLFLLDGCGGATSHGPLIDDYKAAHCLPSLNPGPNGARNWDVALTLTDGSQVVVSATQSPSGGVGVHYAKTGKDVIAADPGDFVYPADLHLNPMNDRLYIKASGLAAGIWHETGLFEYDLRAQKLLKAQKVEDAVLPAECAAKPH